METELHSSGAATIRHAASIRYFNIGHINGTNVSKHLMLS